MMRGGQPRSPRRNPAASLYNRGHEYFEFRIPLVRGGPAAHRRARHRRHDRRCRARRGQHGRLPGRHRVDQEIDAEQIASIDSKDLALPLWNTLAARIDALMADPAVDGIVITHGTDTLEETAYALHLVVNGDKPVVLTAAMRPATALSSDGPLNLLNAVTVAAHPSARGQGVLVAFNNRIHGARDVVKTSTYAVDAFQSPELGALGWVQDGRVEFARRVTRSRDTQLAIAAAWPPVEVVASYAGVTRTAVDALVAAGVRGLVVAGTGNGSIHATLQAALADAVSAGVVVVRASRVGSGHVMRNGAASDDALGFVSAGSLNPFKARVLLMLALANGIHGSDALQRAFDTL
jgi:L-asparaginase